MTTETLLPESLPKEIRLSFLEERKRIWMEIIEMSQNASKNENSPEGLEHWEKINIDANERIKKINQEIILLRSNKSF